MGSPSTFRAGRPASVLIALVVLAISYWMGVVPNQSSDRSPDLAGWNATAAEPTEKPVAASSPQGEVKDTSTPETSGDSDSRSESSDLLHGLLRKISNREYLSPAGLIYGPGSAEGHRLDHLQRHTKDDPRRPGSHGVFDGGMEGALKTIDQAYERAKTGQRTTTQVDEGRTIHTVDLGKRVGFVGGSEGQRRGHPMARRARLVLEGKRVVTAFPL